MPAQSNLSNQINNQAEDNQMNVKLQDKATSIEYTLDNRYEFTKLIGTGSFGKIYEAIDNITHESVAVKIMKINEHQQQNNQKLQISNMLFREAFILDQFQKLKGFCKLYAKGQKPTFIYLILQLLGPNLEIIKQKQGGKFTSLTTSIISLQIITSLETFHNKGFLHRDIKPENFLIGSKKCESGIIYMIDFGLSKQVIPNQPVVIRKGLVGTARYASINAHKGKEQTRKDDLEAWCYLMVYFMLGYLPWQNLQIKDKQEKFDKICEMKEKCNYKELCKTFPYEIQLFITYSMALKPEQIPNYEVLKNYLATCIYNQTRVIINNPFKLPASLKMDWQEDSQILNMQHLDKRNQNCIEQNSKQQQIQEQKNEQEVKQEQKIQQQFNQFNKLTTQETIATQCDVESDNLQILSKDLNDYIFISKMLKHKSQPPQVQENEEEFHNINQKQNLYNSITHNKKGFNFLNVDIHQISNNEFNQMNLSQVAYYQDDEYLTLNQLDEIKINVPYYFDYQPNNLHKTNNNN